MCSQWLLGAKQGEHPPPPGSDGDDAAVAGIFAAKGRPANHPLIVHVTAQGPGPPSPSPVHLAGKAGRADPPL